LSQLKVEEVNDPGAIDIDLTEDDEEENSMSQSGISDKTVNFSFPIVPSERWLFGFCLNLA